MKKLNKKSIIISFTIFLVLSFIGPMVILAATTPSLGVADTFGILSSTFTPTIASTGITGDLGYTTLSTALYFTVSGSTYTDVSGVPAGAIYQQAGTDQLAALNNATDGLNTQVCTPITGTLDAVDIDGVGPIVAGHFTPGCYSITGAMNITATTKIYLDGTGTYIFRSSGALTTGANSEVVLNSASACDVFWAPVGAASLGATSIFKGTIIDAAGISIGDTVNLEGRALAFGGTVGTNHDTIIVPTSCTVPPSTCSLFTYSSWGTCSGSSQSRTVVTSLPSGCTGGSPVLTQSCTVPQSGGGGGPIIVISSIPVPPLINVVKVPTPLSLPLGSGSVTYDYTVSNIGTVPMSNVMVTDNKCLTTNFISGDINNDSKLDVNEIWKYTCTTILLQTTTNTVTATGEANGLIATDLANATVVVGAPVVPPLIHLVKKPSVFILPAGGGAVLYTYTVTNPGTAPLSNVRITDDKCTGLPIRVTGHPGDLNKNDLLESNEVWTFTCQTILLQTTTNTGTVLGSANGFTATDFSFATVVVATTTTPKLPNTGFPPQEKTPWNILVLVSIFVLVSIPFIKIIRNKKI